MQRYGGKVNIGPISLRLSQSALTNAGSDKNYYRERRYDIQAALDLTDLRHRTGDLLPSAIWSPLPTSIWVGYGRGAVDNDPQRGNPNDMTKTLSAGMDWRWNSGYANLSHWSLFKNGRQPGAEAADWLGKGTDIGLGFYGNSWNIDGYMSVQQSDNQDPWTKSADRSLGAGLSTNLYPKSFPALLPKPGRYKHFFMLRVRGNTE